MKFELITDSASNLTDDMINNLDINVITLMFIIDGKEYPSYVKGKQTDNAKYYEMMRQGVDIKTTQMNLDSCYKAFEKILKEGKDVLYISFSSALSGTYNVSKIVAKELQEKYPNNKIYSINSVSASMGQGLLVYYAAQMRKEGKSIDEVKDWVEKNKYNICHYFTVDNLKYLKRGGRLSSASAIIGTVLSIKPILKIDNEGKIVPYKKVKGRIKTISALVEEMKEKCINPKDQLIFISHGDCIEDVYKLKEQILNNFDVKDIVINYIDPVIGSHTGPGTIALFFVGKER